MAEKEGGACVPAPQSLKSQRGSRGVLFREGDGVSGFVLAGGRRSKPRQRESLLAVPHPRRGGRDAGGTRRPGRDPALLAPGVDA